MNTILQLHSKVVTSVILITSIVGLLISIYDPLPEYYGTAVSVGILLVGAKEDSQLLYRRQGNNDN